VAPELVKNVALQIPNDVAWQTLPTDAKIGVSMTVDTTGQTKNIQITKSLNPYWDARVVDALSKAQYHPATVSKSPVAMDVNLVVNIQR
jgi:outer membrane biosynthesis protein TonB